MKNQKVQFRIDEWLFVPYEDKFILHGETIVIDNRLSKLFHFLCENPDIVFSRDELINEVWNGSILSDQVITQAIFELRKILKQHGNHPYGYIVTVPKRGYKLDATVERIIEPAKGPVESVIEEEEQPQSVETEPEVVQEAQVEPEVKEETTPAPATPTPVAPEKKSNSKLWFGFAAVFALIAVIGFYLQGSNSSVNEAPPQVSASEEPEVTTSYLSLEPRYVHVIVEQEVLYDDFKTGVVKTLLDLLKVYQDVRIIYNGPATKFAVHEIRFASSTSQNRTYLEIEYVNRISGHKHLDRKYDITSPSLKPSLKRSLDDLLDSLHIEIDKEILANHVDELPSEEGAIEAIVTAYASTYHAHTQGRALELIQEAEMHSPDNPYVIATNYIYNLSYLYLHPKGDNIEAINKLNAEASEKFAVLESQDKITPKVMEAMAMMALSKDDALLAKNILQTIPHQRKTVLFYVLNGKAAELSGNRDSAEEFYYNAVIEASSTLVLNLSEVLFFNSDLSDIKSKVKDNSL
ncbi:transcriptional activator of cad operon [Vibrio ishigakensis]|uniref:Transcriptional activator of cad operon n=1 Tax=Vibrio ishigakensis TaxID=1481914 RepID=A0A0B8P887_9VIBR|nr:transcriptional activator of cad operon [Vibrio ishigakensis]